MKSKALVHIILAVVLALVAGVLTIRWLVTQRAPVESRKAQVAVKKIDVVVAARPIPKGARLDASMLRAKPYDADAVPMGAERILSEVEGRITARDISQDDPITGDKLLPRGTTAAGLANTVEPGLRAVTVKGSKVLGAGGLITPGSRVDVVATLQPPGQNESKVGKLILQDIPVLATGTEMETRIGKDGKEELANTEFFTLMVTPAQAEKLALAADQGSLHFALRRAGDAQVTATPGSNLGALVGVSGAPAATTASGPPPVPQYTYQAVRASAPKATGGGEQGGAGGAGGAGGGGAAGIGQALGGTPGASPPHGAAQGSANTPRIGATEEGQGTEQITVHQVVIECATCPPR